MKLRPVTLADSELLLNWRNDPDTVAMCKSQRPVERVEHDAWIARMLSVQSGSKLWIGEIDGVPVGTVRLDPLDLRGYAAAVSLMVDKAYRNQGYGGQLLGQLLAAVEKEAGGAGVKELQAEIYWNNWPSRTIFARHGFECPDEDWIPYRKVL